MTRKFLIAILSCMLCTEGAFAAAAPPPAAMSAAAGAGTADLGPSKRQKRFQPVIIGAILGTAFGVSTLSFYGRPQKRLGNAFYGLALGLFFGAGYSLVRAASRDLDRHTLEEREGWQNLALARDLQPGAEMLNFNFDF